MIGYDYVEPLTLDEALEFLATHGEDAHLIAGGASLVVMLHQQLVAPSVLVGLRRIEALRGIETRDDGWLRIGATTTHRQIERSPAVAAHAPALAEAFGHIATVRIRNQGTVGGNLAHADPAQDPPPILMAFDASVTVAGPSGERRIPVADLFVDLFETSLEPGEIITAVELPPRDPSAGAVYVKFLPGSRDDYATVSVAASATIAEDGWRNVRIACGAVGPVPMRMRDAEAALEGTRPDADAFAAAAATVADAVDPLDDTRGSAGYKRDMAVVWVRRALERLAAGGGR